MNKLSATKVVVLLGLIGLIMPSAIAFPLPGVGVAVDEVPRVLPVGEVPRVLPVGEVPKGPKKKSDFPSNMPSSSPGMLGAAPKFGFIMIFFYFLLH
ncbi:hypothetical protein M5689_001211 [Euphorbia peplus]|nr:hypothetical protein M5689_001211 [Euphorbia peplus]